MSAHTTAKIDRSDLPLSHAGATELARFRAGDELFEATFRQADGLGPLYVRASCEACHRSDGRGPGRVGKIGLIAPARPLSLKAGAQLDAKTLEAKLDASLPFGPTERPYTTAGAHTPLMAAAGDKHLRVSYRFPPAVFGRGYLEAVDEREIERLGAEAAKRSGEGEIHGRIHRVPGADAAAATRIGRFGLKARLATIEDFTADAFRGDMGITSPLDPEELPNPEGLTDDAKQGVDISRDVVERVSDYVRLIDIPSRQVHDAARHELGRQRFVAAQCASCHVPSLKTRSDYPVAALAGIDAPVYTDFLLHDMGEALSDGVREGNAGPSEFRTAPLIGLRFFTAFMHDGRAKSVSEAVLAHAGPGSEANGSVTRFQALPASERDALIDFVSGL